MNRDLNFGLNRCSVCLAVSLVLATGCQPAKPPEPPPPSVEFITVTPSDAPIHREWVGILDGMVNAKILAQVTGYLVKRNYKEGDFVKKGQLLYEIDPRTFQAEVDQAKGNLARAQAALTTARLDMQRIQRLLPENAVSVRDRDNAVGREQQAQAEVAAAQAALEKTRLSLGFTRIAAPIDGIAGISKTQLGDLVGPGSANETLTTVSQVNPIKAYLPLSEQQYLKFARAQAAGQTDQAGAIQLILADGSIYPQDGKFYFTDREVDPQTGTIKVAVLFANPDNLLRPGQFARIRAIVKHDQNALLIPQRAVSDQQGRQMVAVITADNSIEIRAVKTGETFGRQWLIEDGLKPGEHVVTEGLQHVRPGMKVTPKPFVEHTANGGQP
jgi:RND family efflux transporter MFP subunit